MRLVLITLSMVGGVVFGALAQQVEKPVFKPSVSPITLSATGRVFVSPSPSSVTNISEIELRAAWFSALTKLAREEQTRGFDWSPLINLLSAVIGGAITGFVAYKTLTFSAARESERLKAQHAQEFAKSTLEARNAYADKLLDLRLKQLELFYAPLRSLLQQSKGIHQKLQTQLLEDNQTTFRKVRRNNADLLEVLWEGHWREWRMLDQLPALKQNSQYLRLIAEIIRIGKNITEIISKHAAFAAQEEVPADVYGEYLAHFAILSQLFDDNARTEAYPPESQKIGYYPRNLNAEVDRGYSVVLNDLKPYLEASSALLTQLANPQAERDT